jgi:hypothetical protein
MSDSTEKYIKILKTNLDKVTIGVLGLMTLGLVGAVMMEKSTDLAASLPEPELLRLEDPLEKNPNWTIVQTMMSRQEMANYPAIRQIRQYNMFDYKSVRDREAIERAANQKYDLAFRARQEGRTEEAKRLAEEVLASIPTHRRAKELLDQLKPPTAATAGTPAPSTPRPAVPQAPRPAAAPVTGTGER